MSNPSEKRSVHPVITQAVVDGLDRLQLQPPALDDVRATIDNGEPVDERVHRALKRHLFDHGGPWASFDTGHHFGATTEHPLACLLTLSRSPSELVHRIRRLEPLLHLGNRTITTVGERELRVTHHGNRGANPTVGESLFVCGAQCGMLARIGTRGIRAETTPGPTALRLWPKRTRSPWPRQSPSHVEAWTITWASAPSAAPVTVTGVLADDIRARITDQPEQPWTVSEVARAFALSRRSLQRSLHHQHTELRRLVLEGRLDAAQALLTRTDVPVSVIAYLCGFADSAHLANVSRSLLGRTPTSIRQQTKTS